SRQPVAALAAFVVPAMAGIVEEQIFLGRQGVAQLRERADDLLLAGVGQQRDGEAVLALERRRHRLGVFHGRVELRQLLVAVVADDEGVVAAVVEGRQLGRDGWRGGGLRLGRRLGLGRRLRLLRGGRGPRGGRAGAGGARV